MEQGQWCRKDDIGAVRGATTRWKDWSIRQLFLETDHAAVSKRTDGGAMPVAERLGVVGEEKKRKKTRKPVREGC